MTTNTTYQERALDSTASLLDHDLELVEVFTAVKHATTLFVTDGEAEFVDRAFPTGYDAAIRESEIGPRIWSRPTANPTASSSSPHACPVGFLTLGWCQ